MLALICDARQFIYWAFRKLRIVVCMIKVWYLITGVFLYRWRPTSTS